MAKKIASKKGKDSEKSFEDSIAELKAIVESMENGEISLEESLTAFERGVELTRHCQQSLQDAEQKILTLSKEGLLETFEEPVPE